MKDLYKLPDGLPVPFDDGACDHLQGRSLPALQLTGSDGAPVGLSTLAGCVVMYLYPMTGRPDGPPMPGWNEIPGARGCTPQACSFRDNYRRLAELGATVFGLSTQTPQEQAETAQRLELPYVLLSDAEHALIEALDLPTFEYRGVRMTRRLTIIAVDGVIVKVFYPVFPPTENVHDVVYWLEKRRVDGNG